MEGSENCGMGPSQSGLASESTVSSSLPFEFEQFTPLPFENGLKVTPPTPNGGEGGGSLHSFWTELVEDKLFFAGK